MTQGYPQTVLLSLGRNSGFTQGNIRLNPTGLTVNEDGTYWANFQVLLVNRNPDYSELMPVFLVTDNTFDPTDFTSQIGATSTIPRPNPKEFIYPLSASGILLNLKAGQTNN